MALSLVFEETLVVTVCRVAKDHEVNLVMLVNPVHQVVTAADQLENEVKQGTVVRTVYLADRAQLDFQVETVNQVSAVNQAHRVSWE